ncbi:MAG: metal-dependent hydrolase [SAR324 cluster bacterium]|nr:metal-dependent hydrolase [SAR324 cluster bacterium]
MLTPAHIVFNHFVYVGASVMFNHPISTGEIVAITLTAPLPDIDTPKSIMGKAFPMASRYLDTHHGHRTITHSIWAVLIIACLATPLVVNSWWTYIAAVAGYFMHIVADTFTKQGPMFFYPKVKAYFVSLVPEFRMVTGGAHEKVLMGIMICSLLFLYPLSYTGLIPIIELLFGNPKKQQTQELTEKRDFDRRLQASEKAKNQRSKTELDAMLQDGIIDRFEYNQMIKEYETTLGEMGLYTAENDIGEDASCLASVEGFNKEFVFVNTSPSCVSVSRNSDGLFPVKLSGADEIPGAVQILKGKVINLACETQEERPVCKFYFEGKLFKP